VQPLRHADLPRISRVWSKIAAECAGASG
jgi:hypothetical protein